MMENIVNDITTVAGKEDPLINPLESPSDGEYTNLDFSPIRQSAFIHDDDSSTATPPVSPQSVPDDEPVALESDWRHTRRTTRGSRLRRRLRNRVRHFLSLGGSDTVALTAETGLPAPVVRMIFAEARLRQIQRRMALRSGTVTESYLASLSRLRQINDPTGRMT